MCIDQICIGLLRLENNSIPNRSMEWAMKESLVLPEI